MKLKEFVDHYQQKTGYKAKKSAKGYQLRCVSHTDTTPSLSVTENSEGLGLKCHAGCSIESIVSNLGLEMKDLFSNSLRKKEYVCSYPYIDERGELLFEMVRYNIKPLYPRRPAPDGAWIWSLSAGEHYKDGDWRLCKGESGEEGKEKKFFPEVRRVLYNLPELLKRPNELVVVVGGEKDVENLKKFGVLATCNPLGEGKWKEDYNEFFKGRRVVLIPDNDETGERHVKLVKSHLISIASEVQIVRLEGLESKEDFSDWIEEHEIEELFDLIYNIKLPNARLSEKALLKSIFNENNLIHEAIVNNVQDAIYFNAHKLIFKAMQSVQVINKTTVAEALGDKLIQAGGLEYIEELSSSDIPASTLSPYIVPILQSKEKRDLIKFASNLLVTIPNSKNVDETKFKLRNELDSSIRLENFQVNDAASIGQDYLENYDKKPQGIPTGFKNIDALAGGLHGGKLYVIAGRPKMAKSSLAFNIAYNVAMQGKNVLYFSLEMGKEELIQRLLSSQAFIPNHKFRDSNFYEGDLERLWTVSQNLPPTLFIDDTPRLTMSKMKAIRSSLEVKKGKMDLVVIDYLGIMNLENSDTRIGLDNLSVELKNDARDNNTPTIVLHQINRSVEARTDKRPQPGDMRDSDGMWMNLDLLMMLYRDEVYNVGSNEGVCEVITAGRNVPPSILNLAFVGKYFRFFNIKIDERR